MAESATIAPRSAAAGVLADLSNGKFADESERRLRRKAHIASTETNNISVARQQMIAAARFVWSEIDGDRLIAHPT
jgi:hypothetical protein